MSFARLANRGMLVLAALGTAMVLSLNLRTDSFARQVLSAAANDLTPPGFDSFRRVDRTVAELGGDDGNVALCFIGFRADDPGDVEFVSRFYYRAAYSIWPRRVFVTEADRVINGGEDVLAEPFEPGREWLRSRGIVATITVRRMPDGLIEFSRTLHR
jgi:hypothetical protein